MTAEFVVAVHAVVYLNHKKTYLSSEEIAENVCTNPARIRKVMNKLKAGGLVAVRAGVSGGYSFCGNQEETTLYDIFKAVGEEFVSVKWRSGDDCAECPVSRNMKPIMDGAFDELDSCAEQKLKSTTVADIDRKIFG